jgi:tRNA 2-thiouridine synthesizing protein A
LPESIADRLDRVLAYLAANDRASCDECEGTLCGHEALMSLAAGRQDAPLCLGCLAQEIGRPRQALRDELAGFILRKECLSQGWDLASGREGVGGSTRPGCLWEGGDAKRPAPPDPTSQSGGDADAASTADGRWDAGETGCGELVLELRLRLDAMPPGAVLHLTARDPGAPEDLPAWCRLTGNALVRAQPPDYWIRRRD